YSVVIETFSPFLLVFGHYSGIIVTSFAVFLVLGHYSLSIDTLIRYIHQFGRCCMTDVLHSILPNTKKATFLSSRLSFTWQRHTLTRVNPHYHRRASLTSVFGLRITMTGESRRHRRSLDLDSFQKEFVLFGNHK